VGLNPNTPLKSAGFLILPSTSVPIPKGEHLVADTPPSPPELPPVVLL